MGLFSWNDATPAIITYSTHKWDIALFPSQILDIPDMAQYRHQHECIVCENIFYRSNKSRRRCYPCHIVSIKKTGPGKHVACCSNSGGVHTSECSMCIRIREQYGMKPDQVWIDE